MARPVKKGLDYFPLDVNIDTDDKLQMIIGEFGMRGEFMYIKLLSWIYERNGYYVEWTQEEQLKFARRVSYAGEPVAFINQVVDRCIQWGLFDKELFAAGGIITSVRIQRTWVEASRKKKNSAIDARWLLLPEFPARKVEETPVKDGRNATNESREKQNRPEAEEGTAADGAATAALPLHVPLSPPGTQHFFALEDLRADAARSPSVQQAVFQMGADPGHLDGWLRHFNDFLRFQGIDRKQTADYRRHFREWLKFIPGYATVHPADFKPVAAKDNGRPQAAGTLSATDQQLLQLMGK